MRDLFRNSSGKIEIVSERYRKSSGVSGKSRGTLKAPERSRKVPECSRTFWNVPECLVGYPLGSAQEGAATWAEKGLKRGQPKGPKRGPLLFTRYCSRPPSPLLGAAGPRGRETLTLGASPSPLYKEGRRCSPMRQIFWLLPSSSLSLRILSTP